MEILINDVPISFELEHEQTAGDVLAGLTAWLSTSGHRIEEVRLNGSPVEANQPWEAESVDTVERLEIRATSIHQTAIDQLETIANYSDLLRRVATEGSDEQLDAVLEELPPVATALARLVPDLEGTLDEPADAARAGTEEDRRRLAQRADEVSRLLQQRQREFLDPEHELRHTVSALQTILPSFEEIPGQLQSGREREAMELVARFAELTGRLLRILPLATATRPAIRTIETDGGTIDEVLAHLTGLFRELEEAMQNQDLVLVGDVMEYELLPGLTSLLDAVMTVLDGPRSDT